MSNLEGLGTSSTSITVGNTDNTQYLSVDSASLNTSPSASTFLPDQNSSTCLLLPNSPSPDPELTHPLTPGLEDPCEVSAGIYIGFAYVITSSRVCYIFFSCYVFTLIRQWWRWCRYKFLVRQQWRHQHGGHDWYWAKWRNRRCFHE